ncbi:MAG: hypothetical protein IJ079_02825 [Lachnospiraceae bacterium]|nr:hypothetical protein [Lachnospiraceae bacterium]
MGSSTTSGSAKTSASGAAESASSVTSSDIKTKTWTPLDNDSCLIPTVKEGYGMSIGNVELSDKAKDYYNSLKKKFGNAEFILVSKDMKASVQANAAAYGNANKMVVLIDEEKLERMATDESYRKKYEGIIAMSQAKLAEAKNSLTSSGANVKNFGMSVNSDGTTSFFATLEKSSKDQAKRIEKKAAEKREQKIKDKKAAEKKAKEARLEKAKEKGRTEREERLKRLKKTDSDDQVDSDDIGIDTEDDKEYIEIQADSMEELLAKVQDHAYTSSGVQAEAEKYTGQNFDFRG